MKEIKTAILAILMFILICGILYPLLITVIAQVFFHKQANGSIIKIGEEKVGSFYVGQNFSEEQYFWGRPSISEYEYSAASNKSITDEAFKQVKEKRREMLKQTAQNDKEIPQELVDYSGSGIDPNITVEAARFQIERIAKNRGIDEEKIASLIEENIINKNDMIGEKVVNVLLLNIALNTLS